MRIATIFTLLFFSIATPLQYSIAEQTQNMKLKMAENNPVAGVGCKAYKILTSGITKAFVVLIFIITGMGFFIGKVSWGIVISLLIGTGLTLTSGTLVKTFVGEAGRGGGDGDVCECKYGLNSEGECKSALNS